MNQLPRSMPQVLAFAAALALAACGGRSGDDAPGATGAEAQEEAREPAVAFQPPPPPPQVAGVAFLGLDLGKSANLDGRVLEPTRDFAPMDSIHVTVTAASEADATGTLEATMTHPDGDVFATASRPFALSGPGIVPLVLQNTGERWPLATYRLRITLDGETFAETDFRVSE